MISKENILAWINLLADEINDNKEYLTELDSQIGDADHGINMSRGFKKVQEKLPDLEEKDIGGVLKGVGMALVSSVGGASGPLYGTFFMKAGGAVDGKQEINLAELAELFSAGYEGVKSRGKAQPGEKTMLDAMEPALGALNAAAEDGKTVADALVDAMQAAEAGMEATTDMKATKGRASYLGERSIGHKDPGATSTYLLFKTAKEALS